jgi:MoxR-like ATPase
MTTLHDDVVAHIERRIVGKRAVIDLVLDAVAAGGHVLLDDVPGVAKTLLARTLADATGLGFSRLQFTPDLMPADVTGSSVWNPASNTIEFQPGPIFANVVLADEINRAPAKTQSALLEAMAEQQVTVDGTTHQLPDPFVVIATQNPIDHDGTYALPEAQLDRFLIRTTMGYPAAPDEAEVVRRHLLQRASTQPASTQSASAQSTSAQPASTQSASARSSNVVAELRSGARAVVVHDAIIDYAVRLVEATRQHNGIELGASPRGSIGLITVAQARAARLGRTHVLPDDVKAIAAAVLGHRLVLTSELWIDRVPPERLIGQILGSVAAPAPNDVLDPA